MNWEEYVVKIKTSLKYGIPVLFFVIPIVGVCLAMWYVVSFTQSTPPNDRTTSENVPTVDNLGNGSVPDIANGGVTALATEGWSEYKNDEYGLSFKHPQGVRISTIGPNIPAIRSLYGIPTEATDILVLEEIEVDEECFDPSSCHPYFNRRTLLNLFVTSNDVSPLFSAGQWLLSPCNGKVSNRYLIADVTEHEKDGYAVRRVQLISNDGPRTGVEEDNLNWMNFAVREGTYYCVAHPQNPLVLYYANRLPEESKEQAEAMIQSLSITQPTSIPAFLRYEGPKFNGQSYVQFYSNSTYGMNIVLPVYFGEYMITEGLSVAASSAVDEIHFDMDTTGFNWSGPFGVSVLVYDNEWWENNVQLDTSGQVRQIGATADVGLYLGGNSQYSFVLQKGSDCPTKERLGSVSTVTPHCEFLEQVEDIFKGASFLEVVDTSSWQEFQNEEYGLELRLPQIYKVREADGVLTFYENYPDSHSLRIKYKEITSRSFEEEIEGMIRKQVETEWGGFNRKVDLNGLVALETYSPGTKRRYIYFQHPYTKKAIEIEFWKGLDMSEQIISSIKYLPDTAP